MAWHKKTATTRCGFITLSHPLPQSAFTLAASLETFRDAVFRCKTPSWALRMMTGCASLRTSPRDVRITSVNRQLNLFDKCPHTAQPVAVNCATTFCLADTFFRRCMVSHICGSIGVYNFWTPGYTDRLVKRQPYGGRCFLVFPSKPDVTFACGRRNKCSGQTERDDRYPRFWQHHNRSQDRALFPDRKL